MSIKVNGKELTYKIGAVLQHRENYGAHSWDGKGECPQYWKNKGGQYILLADGITSAMLKDSKFMEMLAEKGRKYEEFNDYCEYWFQGLDIALSDAPSHDEVISAYCDWGVDLEEEPTDWVVEADNTPLDRFDAMAESIQSK